MSRGRRITLIVLGSILGAIVLIVVAGILIVQTAWFSNLVREKIIAYTEQATGGKVDIAGFRFDWRNLRADVYDFIIHGTEPPAKPPLLRAERIELQLELFPSFHHVIELEYLAIDKPHVDVIVNPDGTTNVPSPKLKPTSNTTVLEDVVNLAIRRFEIRNGIVDFADRRSAFDARGENLRAHLSYNIAESSYSGQVSMNPLYIKTGDNQRLDLNVTLPVYLQRDLIRFNNARIATAKSEIAIDGTIDRLRDPRENLHLKARVSLEDVKAALGAQAPLDLRGANVPKVLSADLAAKIDGNDIQISSAHLKLGASEFEGSGSLKNASSDTAADFQGKLSLDELGRLLDISGQPRGTVQIAGQAKLNGPSDYLVTGNVSATGVSAVEAGAQIKNIGLNAHFKADPKEITLSDARLRGFGGEFTGNAKLEDMRRFHLNGNLSGFNLNQLAQTLTGQGLGYAGNVSGPVQAEGDLKAKGTAGLRANVHLTVAPGKNGVPVSGQINAAYNGSTGAVDLGKSYLKLPSSRIDLSGSLGNQVQFDFTSRNLKDLQPALALAGKNAPKDLPLRLEPGGVATIKGTISGKLANPQISAHADVSNFAAQDRRFDRFSADLSASPNGATLSHASLTRGGLQLNADASIPLSHWKALGTAPLNVNTTIRNAGVADMLALAGFKDVPITGTLNASAHLTGTLSNPQGHIDATVTDGTAYDQHFDRLTAGINLADRVVTIPSAQLIAGTARLNLTATYRHPADSFNTGHFDVHAASNAMPIDQFNALQKQRSGLGGTIQVVNADASGDLLQGKTSTVLQVSNVNANIVGRGLREDGQNLGDFTATARTANNVVNYHIDSGFAGSNILVNGQTELVAGYPATATASIRNLPVARVLAVADRRDLPFSGLLTADAQLSGALSNPRATADVKLVNGNFYEHIDSLQARFTYSDRLIDIPSLEVTSGAAHANLTASYTHPAGQLDSGDFHFRLNTNNVELSQLKQVQKLEPGVAGVVQVNAEGSGKLQNQPGQPAVLFSNLNGRASATGIVLNRQSFGDASLTAHTNGQDLVLNLDSNFAGAQIHGNGKAQLTGNYPVTAQLSFSNLTYAGFRPFIPATSALPASLDASTEGVIQLSGPLLKPEEIRAELRLPKLQVSASERGAMTGAGDANGRSRITLHNEGPIVASLSHSVIHVDSAHIVGPSTDIAVTGNAALQPNRAFDLHINANTNLGLIQDFNKDVYSSGNVIVDTAITGPFNDPQVNGKIELKNAAFNMIDSPNGLSKANGIILLNGRTATIQSLTGESGGGAVAATGTVELVSGVLQFKLAATGRAVRVRYPEGVSTLANANLTLTGSSNASTLGGTITIVRTEFNPRSDFGSVLSSAAPPVQTPAAPDSLLGTVHLKVGIRSIPNLAFQTSLAQNVQVAANLNVTGTLEEPGVTGRINITQGQLVFFGTKYNVNQGTIAFYDPFRIEPILDINLETIAEGVDIILNVSGPIDNLQLTHRSDPPLPFDQLISLLATGKAPTSNPTIAANQPVAPPQTAQQMGESALLGQVVASPVSSRLQRVFGVNQLKIAPAFVTGSELPQARLTLEQQISSNVTFTYITDLTNPNQQIIRVEWDINKRWAAVATRDENGLFGVNFYYKRKFK